MNSSGFLLRASNGYAVCEEEKVQLLGKPGKTGARVQRLSRSQSRKCVWVQPADIATCQLD